MERRVGQRFPYLLPVSLRDPVSGIESVGFTQDLSSKGVFFFTDAPLVDGSQIELTLKMPSEITLGESMPVRCRGTILRVVRPAAAMFGACSGLAETKIGVAVRLEQYEYLPTDSCVNGPRVAALHPQRDEDQELAHSTARP